MNILVMGEQEDPHAQKILKVLLQRGVKALLMSTGEFPQRLQISWHPNLVEGALCFPCGKSIKFGDIHAVYWRSLSQPNLVDLHDGYQQLLAQQDSMSVLRTFLNGTPARWVNAWAAYDFHKEKPLQLARVGALGVNIPKSLVSNSVQQIQAFCQLLPSAIYKPVYGGSHTEFLTDELLETSRLAQVLSISPVTIQEYIAGTNIRCYVIGDKVFSAEIRSDSVDFREDGQAQILPLTLPPDVEAHCLLIRRELGLAWTAIDWRRHASGDYYFLEANPSPMFIHFEDVTGFPIADTLVDLLIKP